MVQAAKRRKNAAHGVSRAGDRPRNNRQPRAKEKSPSHENQNPHQTPDSPDFHTPHSRLAYPLPANKLHENLTGHGLS